MKPKLHRANFLEILDLLPELHSQDLDHIASAITALLSIRAIYRHNKPSELTIQL